MLRILISTVFLLTAAVSFTACTNAAAADSLIDDSALNGESETGTNADDKEAPLLLYATVDRLAIRAVPDSKGESLGTLAHGSSVTTSGEVTDFKEKITLRGQPHYEPWRKVVLQEPGKKAVTGWTYGGGLSETKPAPEAKRPAKPTPTSAADLRAALETKEHAAAKNTLPSPALS